MTSVFYPNLKNYKILTAQGYKPFGGISRMAPVPVYRVTLGSGQYIEATWDHKIFINGETHCSISEIEVGDEIFTLSGFQPVVNIEHTRQIDYVYDIIESAGNNAFYANGILSSNCEFVTFEETLISAAKLNQLEPMQPIRRTGQVRWYKDINPHSTYVVSLDPSMGTGGDSAAIQVFELPSLEQVAEWCNNRLSVEVQVRTMREIMDEIHRTGQPEIYWSVESNGMGEAAIVVINESGEENFPGTMLHDPKNKSHGRRRGFVTTNKSKLETCARLKFLVESGRLKIHSRALISELKVFVSRSNTYEARTGQTDDLVMSTILALRMIDYISTWDDQSQAAISTSIVVPDDNDDYESPMPIFI